MKDFLKISEKPGQFYESLKYQNKRVFKNILFPEGFRFSMKNKECRTSKLNILFDLTSSFSKTYDTKKEKTQTQKVLESHLVDNSIEISNFKFSRKSFIETSSLIDKIIN
jgi:hypothetical protein